MPARRLLVYVVSVVALTSLTQCTAAQTQPQRVVIRADTMHDGRGGVRHNVRIVIDGPRILAIDLEPGAADYSLRGLTVLPGWIDAHVHIASRFGKDGKNGSPFGTEAEAAYQVASNAWATLTAGFTTIQSLGSPADVPLRDAIAKGLLPGPAS